MTKMLDVCCKQNNNSILSNLSIIMKLLKRPFEANSLNELNSLIEKKDINVEIKDYVSLDGKCEKNSFLSNLMFWEDVEKIVKQAIILKKEEKIEFMKNKLRKLNENLPGPVYIPFKKSDNITNIYYIFIIIIESLRNFTVLSIIPEETIWFNSKEKSPILLFFEIFRIEELLENCIALDENNQTNKEIKMMDKKLSLISNFSYLYFDYLLSKPICLEQVSFLFL